MAKHQLVENPNVSNKKEKVVELAGRLLFFFLNYSHFEMILISRTAMSKGK